MLPNLFSVLVVSAAIAALISGHSAEAGNFNLRLAATSCNVDNLNANEESINDSGMINNEDDTLNADIWCDIPMFLSAFDVDEGAGTTLAIAGTDRTCDLDSVVIKINDGNSTVGTTNGVEVTLMTTNGSFAVVDSCVAINTESISAGRTGISDLRYDEAPSGIEEDIDTCTNDNATEFLMIHVNLPDDQGAGSLTSTIMGITIQDTDDGDTGCST